MEVEWKLETENGNGNWKRKWKCTNRWCAVLHMRKVGIAEDTALPRGDGTVCGDGRRHQIQPHQPRRLEGRASLAEGCASNPIVLDDEDSFASSGSICFFTNLYVA